MCRIGSWVGEYIGACRLDRLSRYTIVERVFLRLGRQEREASRQNGGGTARHSGSASVPNRIYFGDDFLGRLLALAQRDPHHSQKPVERIYTNVARWSPHQFRVVSPTRSKSVALICIRLLFARPETDPAIYRVDPFRTDIWFLFSLFRKQQQQNCLRRQVRFSVAILILIPLVKLNKTKKCKRDRRGDKRELARWVGIEKKKSRTIGCHRLAPFHLTAVKPQKRGKKMFLSLLGLYRVHSLECVVYIRVIAQLLVSQCLPHTKRQARCFSPCV